MTKEDEILQALKNIERLLSYIATNTSKTGSFYIAPGVMPSGTALAGAIDSDLKKS